MARSTRGLYKRGEKWWMTYRDGIGTQRFESCKTANKKEAEQRLIDRRKEAQEGLAPAPPFSRSPWRSCKRGICPLRAISAE